MSNWAFLVLLHTLPLLDPPQNSRSKEHKLNHLAPDQISQELPIGMSQCHLSEKRTINTSDTPIHQFAEQHAEHHRKSAISTLILLDIIFLPQNTVKQDGSSALTSNAEGPQDARTIWCQHSSILSASFEDGADQRNSISLQYRWSLRQLFLSEGYL